MKTFRFLTLAVIALLAGGFFQSCSDDDDGPGGSSKDLIGLWEFTYHSEWEKVNGEIVYEDEGEIVNDQRLEFCEDGTIIEYNYSRGSWVVWSNGTYSYKNGKLYINFGDGDDDGETPIKVTTLTSSTLVLEGSYKYTEDGDTYEEWMQSTYTKVRDSE